MKSTTHGVPPVTADIGDRPETLASLQEVQRSVYARFNGLQDRLAGRPGGRHWNFASVLTLPCSRCALIL